MSTGSVGLECRKRMYLSHDRAAAGGGRQCWGALGRRGAVRPSNSGQNRPRRSSSAGTSSSAMGRPTAGLGRRPGGKRACRQKGGTGNKQKAAARDAAAKAAAERAAQIEELRQERDTQNQSPQTQPRQQHRRRKQKHTSPSQERLKRAAIEYAYVRLNLRAWTLCDCL